MGIFGSSFKYLEYKSSKSWIFVGKSNMDFAKYLRPSDC